MENATKALIFAGSVLIAIVLIAVGIKILTSAQGVTNSVEGLSQSMQVAISNSQFTKYEGRRTGLEVKELLNTIIINNSNSNNYAIEVALFDR